MQVIVWDTNSLSAYGQHLLHHASVAAIGISPNDRFVASAGGEDDSSVFVWDIESRTPICSKSKCLIHPYIETLVAIYIYIYAPSNDKYVAF